MLPFQPEWWVVHVGTHMQKTVVILKELFYFSLQVSPGWISRWSESLRPILISSSDQSLLSFWQGAERMGERSPRNHWAVRLKKTLFRKYLSIHKCFEMLHLWLPTACLPYISVNLVDVIFFFFPQFHEKKRHHRERNSSGFVRPAVDRKEVHP